MPTKKKAAKPAPRTKSTAPEKKRATAKAKKAAPARTGPAAVKAKTTTTATPKPTPKPKSATARTKPTAAKTRSAKPTPSKANAPTKKSAAAKTKTKTKTNAPTKNSAVAKAKLTPLAGGGRVVEILDDEQPIEALRRYLATIPGRASIQEGQVALGSAQLMLLPIAREHRGGPEVKALLDLVLTRWDAFPDPDGFHAQEFLRNAFAAVGDDPERIARLIDLVPAEPSPELQFNIACAYAVGGDKPAMLVALRAAVSEGVTAAQVRRDGDFAEFLYDPELLDLLDGARAPVIPIDVDPHIEPVREALDALISTLEELGQHGKLNPPASLDLVLSAERAKKIQLPNDYRALLTIADGFAIWDNEFLGTNDFRTDTPLAKSAREYLEMSASYGATGIDECVPIANWGQPNDWLLFDPRGTIRGGEPGYVLMLNADELPIDDLVAALDRIARIAADVLGTN